jgi:Bacteriophage minor capsid protein
LIEGRLILLRVNDLRNYVETSFSIKTYNNDFYAQSDTNCAMVRITPGTTNSRNINRLNFQILLRDERAANAEAKAWEIYEALRVKTDFLVGSTKVIRCFANQPLYIGPDESGRTQYSINCSVITDEV